MKDEKPPFQLEFYGNNRHNRGEQSEVII